MPVEPSAQPAVTRDHALPEAAPARVSPVQAVLIGWLSVALWNVGDIARMPVRPNGLAVRTAHYAVDLGHVLAVALPIAAAVAIWTRFVARSWLWGALFVAIVSGVLGPLVLSGDLAPALERLYPEVHDAWLLPAVCVVIGQTVTACFIAGHLCARLRLRWLAIGMGLALLVAHDFILKTGYPGAHVLLSASGATLIAAALVGAPAAWLGAGFRRVLSWQGAVWRLLSTARRRPSLVWAIAALFAVLSLAAKPSSRLQVELLERDTTLLFPWLRWLYAPARIGEVSIPRNLRHWFESRAGRPDIPPATESFLPQAPIVLLITIDSLRVDLMSPSYRHVAPNLHAIKDKSVYFAQARSSGSDTRFSMATLFTGRHYSMLNWTSRRSRRRPTLEREPLPRLPELLQKAGVQTVVAPSVSMLDPKQGIVRGFAEELVLTEDRKYRSASAEIADRAIERLRGQGPLPMFFYTHLMEPHDPYETYGRPAKSKFDAYLIEVSIADEELGRIRRAVKEFGLEHRTVFMIGADHGEGFGEHRIFTHGRALYDILVHVPMMIEIPGVSPRTVDDFVSLMDFGPTVLDIFGVPTPGHWVSESLSPFLAGGRGDPDRVLLMEKYSHKAMIFPDGLKLMTRRSAYELYDVIRDPAENNNLWEQSGEEGPRRLALLQAYVQSHSNRAGLPLDAEDEE